MGYLAEEITSVCSRLGYDFNYLNLRDSQNVISIIKDKFCCGKNKSPLWESILNSKGVYNQRGWSWISEFVGDIPILIFFEQSDDKSIVRLENGSYLSKILGECFGFVFYITDLDYNYLVCFNDHDILMGAGTASDWIENKAGK